MLIDFHTHSEREGDDILEVISIDPSRPRVAQWYTIGYHPWWIDGILSDAQLDVLKNSLEHDPHCLALGECGLDKLKGIDLKTQEKIFIQQIELANAMGAPMIIHCVRVYDTVLKLHRKMATTPWVVHGYRRHPILAKSIVERGIYLSIAPSQRMAASFVETLKWLPEDRFFVETDSETSMNIKQRYELLASIRNMDICKLENQMVENFKSFFAWKPLGWNELRY